MKRYYRFFGGFMDTQEKWLNEMAHKGYRLVHTGKMTYDFEQCQPDEYQYCVEFVAHKSYKSLKEYRGFLEELGYTVFYKNANLNYSIGKVRWRAYGNKGEQIATNPGNYNKELLIVEKKNDGHCFKLHTINSDKADYYKPLRNAWLTLAILSLALSAWQYISGGVISKEVIVFGVLGIFLFIPTIRYQKRINYFTKNANIEE